MNIESNGLLDVEPLSEKARAQARARVYASVADAKRRRRNGTTSALGALTVIAAGVVYPSLNPTTAYASWTAVPTSGSISATDSRVQSCLGSLPTGPVESVGSSESLAPAVVESRGNFTATLLGAGDSIAFCIFDEHNRASGRTIAPPLHGEEIVSVIGNGGSLDEEGARYAYGRVAATVQRVRVETSDSVQVTASVSNGYYLAWWPSNKPPQTVTALDSSGRVLHELTLP